jgi:hypothetical protein
MKLDIPIIAALIATMGVVVGSLMQAAIARSNRNHERQLALEIKRTEQRISAYVALMQHVADAEERAGRNFKAYGSAATAHREVGSAIHQAELDPLTRAQLLTFASVRLDAIYASWMYNYLEHTHARSILEGLVAISEVNGGIVSRDLGTAKKLSELTGRRAARSARLVGLQVHAELQGNTSWLRSHMSLPKLLKNRRDEKNLRVEEMFVEKELPRLSAVFTSWFEQNKDQVEESDDQSQGGESNESDTNKAPN